MFLTLGLVSGPAFAAPSDQGAEKEVLLGNNAVLYCDSLEPYPGDFVSDPVGFVIFNATKDKLMAQVVVKGATPNLELPVRLIQGGSGGGEDCHEVDGYVKTNKQGKGTLHLSEPITGTRAQVIIDTGGIYGTPTYRASEFYDIGTS